MRDQTYWAYNYCPTSFSWLVLLGLVFYLAAFAPGERLNLSFSPHEIQHQDAFGENKTNNNKKRTIN